MTTIFISRATSPLVNSYIKPACCPDLFISTLYYRGQVHEHRCPPA